MYSTALPSAADTVDAFAADVAATAADEDVDDEEEEERARAAATGGTADSESESESASESELELEEEEDEEEEEDDDEEEEVEDFAVSSAAADGCWDSQKRRCVATSCLFGSLPLSVRSWSANHCTQAGRFPFAKTKSSSSEGMMGRGSRAPGVSGALRRPEAP
jgi:hypothetical protein